MWGCPGGKNWWAGQSGSVAANWKYEGARCRGKTDKGMPVFSSQTQGSSIHFSYAETFCSVLCIRIASYLLSFFFFFYEQSHDPVKCWELDGVPPRDESSKEF